jgi:hypothetical protein
MSAIGARFSRGHRVRRRSAAVIAFTILAMSLPAAALAAGTLDQGQAAIGSVRALIGTYDNGTSTVLQAQTFRAGLTGSLDQVDVQIRVVGDPGVPLQVEIWAVDGTGAPTGSALGSASLPEAGVPVCATAACVDLTPSGGDWTNFSFVSVPLTTPASVTAGSSYALVLSAVGATAGIDGPPVHGANRYEWAGTSDGSAYSNGSDYSFVSGGVEPWFQDPNDLAFTTYVSPMAYTAAIQQPINADGSSVFKAGKGAIPVKFNLSANGQATCNLPAATIGLIQTDGSVTGTVNETAYLLASDSGSAFRISSCQYVYNLSTKGLSTGTYRVEISIGDTVVGSATFDLR